MKLRATIRRSRPGIWTALVEDKIRVALRDPFVVGRLFSSWQEALDYSLGIIADNK